MAEPSPDRTALLEQYKLLVQSAEKISERRTSANNYLLTVNAALVSLHRALPFASDCNPLSARDAAT